jgi:peptidoglycan/xylan/chitin deacetylase (PgdA/CDA1 family)
MNSIITFHKIRNSLWFNDVICFLKSRYRFVPIESLRNFYSRSACLTNACHIAVDDGDKSFYELIFPVLLKHQVPASLFVSPKSCATKVNFWFQEIDGYDQLELKRISAQTLNVSLTALMKYSITSILKGMSIKQIEGVISRYQEKVETRKKEYQNITVDGLRVLDKSGLVSIGAHTMSHPILKNEDDLTCEREITQSINELSLLLGHKIRYFAYPNGIPDVDFTEREEGYLRSDGIELAFTTESKHLSSADNIMRIPRIQISSDESMSSVKAKLFLGSKWNTLKKLKPSGEYAERKQLRLIVGRNN